MLTAAGGLTRLAQSIPTGAFALPHSAKGTSVIRRAYTIHLTPGALAEYTRKHDEIWPELVEEFRKQGIAQLTAFVADPVVFYYAEVVREDAFDRLFLTAVHDRWAKEFTDLIAFDADGQVSAPFLTEIFHLETAAARA
jgi:L-rhamnose mutarotase